MAEAFMFDYEGIKCNFSSTFRDDLACDAFMAAFADLGLPRFPPVDAEGKSTEGSPRSWWRVWCAIAAYAKDIEGMGGWIPPSLFATKSSIIASAEVFFSLVNGDIIEKWTHAFNEARGGAALASVAPEEQGSGTDADFLASMGQTSPDGSTTSPPES